ncbi:MAG: hypothetical protein MZV63_23770 [Marinilabiliales bacterium]|nr:hypothetical protein [Marinilabiliales bacterium]
METHEARHVRCLCAAVATLGAGPQERMLQPGDLAPDFTPARVGREDAQPRRLPRHQARRHRLVPQGQHQDLNARVRSAPCGRSRRFGRSTWRSSRPASTSEDRNREVAEVLDLAAPDPQRSRRGGSRKPTACWRADDGRRPAGRSTSGRTGASCTSTGP